jgi:hypothetical protein
MAPRDLRMGRKGVRQKGIYGLTAEEAIAGHLMRPGLDWKKVKSMFGS